LRRELDLRESGGNFSGCLNVNLLERDHWKTEIWRWIVVGRSNFDFFFSSKARAKIRTGQPTITNGNDGMMGFTQDSFKRKKHVRRINNGKKMGLNQSVSGGANAIKLKLCSSGFRLICK